MPSSPFDSGADAPLTVTADSAWTRPHPVTSDSTCSTTTTTATVHTPLTPPLTPTKPLVRCPSPSRSPSPSPTDLAASAIQNVHAIQVPPRRPSASDPYHRYEHGAGQDPTDRALASNASIAPLARTTTTTTSSSRSPPRSPLPLPTLKFETMDTRTSEMERSGTAERERDWATSREQARAALGGRARTLRLNTLQKRGHHPDELSPLPLPYPASPAHTSSSPPPASSSYPTSSSCPSFSHSSYPVHPHQDSHSYQHHLPSSSSDSRLSYPYAYDPSHSPHPNASHPAPSSKSKFRTLHTGPTSPLLRRLYALPLVRQRLVLMGSKRHPPKR